MYKFSSGERYQLKQVCEQFMVKENNKHKLVIFIKAHFFMAQ